MALKSMFAKYNCTIDEYCVYPCYVIHVEKIYKMTKYIACVTNNDNIIYLYK